MNRTEFINFIISIGFKWDDHIHNLDYYKYEKHIILLNLNCYTYYNGSEYLNYHLDDLTILMKITRDYKLKKILTKQ